MLCSRIHKKLLKIMHPNFTLKRIVKLDAFINSPAKIANSKNLEHCLSMVLKAESEILGIYRKMHANEDS